MDSKMKRFAEEFEELLSPDKVFLTLKGPIRKNIYRRNFIESSNESKMVDNTEEMEVDSDHEMNYNLDDASCNFLKKCGQIYHLYVYNNGKQYFSMISPEEWGIPPHKYIGSWKFQHDSTWKNVTLKSS